MTSGVKMGQIEWAMWANEQAIVSSSIIILGGILGVAGFFKGWEIGIYAIIAGVLNTRENVSEILYETFELLWACVQELFLRFIMHLILCIPMCFILATIMGGISLFTTAMIYLVAAFKGEEWKPVGLEEKTESTAKKDAKSFRQPKMPPPRAPPSANQI
ncbi:CYBA [Mytilus coruscus]|uniref:Cytochrome b-245 light chain n=1 Tax=Mytilus coruscus TaxID=42192 RepID=A0A6J8CD87_MYTCO|nr:CYBA [Mytilus coruscus]